MVKKNDGSQNGLQKQKSEPGKITQKAWERIFFPIIKKRLNGINIKDLKDQEMLSNSREIRIWVGFSIDPLKGIIMRENNGEWSAVYIPPSDYVSNKSLPPYTVPPPQSGWKSLWNNLERLGIYTLSDATDIGADNMYPDAVGVVIEIKTPNSYRAYNYNGFATSEKPEAKKVKEIVATLSHEFRIVLY